MAQPEQQSQADTRTRTPSLMSDAEVVRKMKMLWTLEQAKEKNPEVFEGINEETGRPRLKILQTLEQEVDLWLRARLDQERKKIGKGSSLAPVVAEWFEQEEPADTDPAHDAWGLHQALAEKWRDTRQLLLRLPDEKVSVEKREAVQHALEILEHERERIREERKEKPGETGETRKEQEPELDNKYLRVWGKMNSIRLQKGLGSEDADQQKASEEYRNTLRRYLKEIEDALPQRASTQFTNYIVQPFLQEFGLFIETRGSSHTSLELRDDTRHQVTKQFRQFEQVLSQTRTDAGVLEVSPEDQQDLLRFLRVIVRESLQHDLDRDSTSADTLLWKIQDDVRYTYKDVDLGHREVRRRIWTLLWEKEKKQDEALELKQGFENVLREYVEKETPDEKRQKELMQKIMNPIILEIKSYNERKKKEIRKAETQRRKRQLEEEAAA